MTRIWSVHFEETGRLLAIATDYSSAVDYSEAVPGTVVRRSAMDGVFELSAPEVYELDDEDEDEGWIVANGQRYLTAGTNGEPYWGPYVDRAMRWPRVGALSCAVRFGGEPLRVS
jgi:hypothetical protein